MIHEEWYKNDFDEIVLRLKRLRNLSNGIIERKKTELHDIEVRKIESQIHLIFVDPTASEIMSRIDIDNPLNLLALYTKAFMLFLLWNDAPSRVYMIGFGGGRVPMILHHYFPEVIVECTDIEPALIGIAKKYFGIKFDNRLVVAIEDGREYLFKQDQSVQYDAIMMDGFRGNGYGPYRFSTIDFLAMCKSHLSKNGVMVINLLTGDQLYYEKIFTFKQVFTHTYLYLHEGACVLIGTENPQLQKTDLFNRASLLQEKYKFPFQIGEGTSHLITGAALEMLLMNKNLCVLTDADPPLGYFDSLSPLSTVFVKAKRNDPCPCGSGKLFKLCHAPQLSRLQSAYAKSKKDDPCPCGSGKKYKDCHGRN